MKKKTESIQKRIKGKMKSIEKEEQKKRTSITHARISLTNLELLGDLKDCIEIDYEVEMDDLRIKKLTIDDVITRVLWAAKADLAITPEMFDSESKMIKLINYRGLA